MSIVCLRWKSNVLGNETRLTAVLPDDVPPPWPVLYLLHGMWDTCDAWLDKARLARHLAGRPIAVFTPDGFNSWYTNHHDGPRWFDHVADELPAFVERTFHVRTDCGGRCVGGLSMGGYGALRLTLARPDRYASAHSHSGGVMHGSRPGPGAGSSLDAGLFRRIFGDDPAGTDHDLLALADRLPATSRPALRLDCGTGDFLHADNVAFHDALAARGVAHEWHEHPGGHDWDYWDARLPAALDFHLAALTDG